MVNVPGRSKACHNCRRRRIACDQQKPCCGRCLKANLSCEGYKRERIFVVDTAEARHQRVTGLQQPSKAATRTHLPEPGHHHHQRRRSRSRPLYPDPKKASIYSIMPLSPLSTAILPYAAHRTALMANFVTPDKDWWLAPIHRLPSMPPALETAVLAVCTAHLGRMSGDPRLRAASLQMYANGLNELQSALLDPVAVCADETLAAGLALAMYELIECPSGAKKPYLNHREGCAALVRHRGMERCKAGWGRTLYGIVRYQSVFASLEARQESFVMREPWSNFEPTTGPLGHLERIIGFMGLIPGLLSRADGLRDEELDNGKRFEQMDTLLAQLWELNTILEEHWEELRAERPGKPLFWYTEKRINDLTEEKDEHGSPLDGSPSHAIEFPDLPIADIIVLMWALEAMLWSGMCVLHFALPPTALMAGRLDFSMESKYPTLGHRQNWIECVRKVCSAVDYCTNENGLTGPRIASSLGLLVGMMKEHGQYRKEMNWLQEAYNRVGQTRMKFLRAI